MDNDDETLRREISDLFGDLQTVFLATVDGVQPRVRPVTLIHVGGKLFVGTGAGDAKAAQVRKNSKVEFCLLLEKGEAKGTLRAECDAKIVTDRAVKADVYERVAFMKEFWSNPDDPRFVLLSLEPMCFEYMPAGSMQATKVKA